MRTLLHRVPALLLTVGLVMAIAPGAHAASGGTLGLNLSARYSGNGSGPLVGALVTAENIDTALVYAVPAYGDPTSSAYYQANLPFGRYRLRVERVGFATTYWPRQYSRETAAPITFGSAPGCNPADAATCDLHILTAQIDQAVTLSGTVRHRSGQPQPDAVVTATRTAEPSFHPSTTTAAGGAYTLQVPPGSYELSTRNGEANVRKAVDVTGPASHDLTLLSTPGVPRDVVVTTSNRQAAVFWSPPVDDGGSPITSYTVVASPDGGTCSTGTTSCAFSGLVNARTYTFSISATNLIGSGGRVSTDAIVQGPVPAPAHNVRVAASDRALDVIWSASPSDEIREYVATASPGGKSCSTADLTCTIRGLHNGRTYRVSVTGRTATAESPPASAAKSIAPLGLPAAPRNVRVRPVAAALKVRWRAPLDDGGRRIQEYIATAWPGGRTCQTDGRTHCTIRGLRTGNAYTVTVRAAHQAGVGAMSPGSAPVDVLPGPGLPTRIRGLQVRRTATAVHASWRPVRLASAYWVRLRAVGEPAGTWSVVNSPHARFAEQPGAAKIEVRAVGRTGPGPISRQSVG